MLSLIDWLRRQAAARLLAPPSLAAPTEYERGWLEELRERVTALEHISPQSHDFWTANEKKLAQRIMSEDPRAFTRWPEVNPPMFHTAQRVEYAALKNSSQWQRWQQAIRETGTGSPPPYYLQGDLNGNAVHHAYSLQHLLAHTHQDVKDIRRVVEFGGGYGSFCRLLHGMGFQGDYTIYDLPVFCLLQWYYLSQQKLGKVAVNELTPPARLRTLWSTGLLEQTCQQGEPIDLFVALWSITEVPDELRNWVLQVLGPVRKIFIAYHNTYKEYNNLDYIKLLRKQLGQYRWHDEQIAHLPHNGYLIGELR
jgi:hypothetical protein